MSSILARIKKGNIDFGNPVNHEKWERFAFKHEGKLIKITDEDEITIEQRKFFEGAIVPYVALQTFLIDPETNKWDHWKLEEAREELKKEFNYVYVRQLDGSVSKSPKSTTRLGKTRFSKFNNAILEWMEENGMTIPDTEDYKAWKKANPRYGAIYPPLEKLTRRRLTELQFLNGEVDVSLIDNVSKAFIEKTVERVIALRRA